jgi:aryl-alcohol dehydrogenase (NADP+)
MSPLCLGTMMFGSRLDEKASRAILDRAFDRGIAFFDLADAYPFPPSAETWGRSEEVVGHWLMSRRLRGEVSLATKCGLSIPDLGSAPSGSRAHVIAACEGSLRRLGVDHVDVFYLHKPALDAPLEETVHALDHLVASGKVGRIGLSNLDCWQVAMALELIAAAQLAPVSALQPLYNLLRRTPERDLLPLARAKGMEVMPYYAFGAGVLAGRYTRGQPLPVDFRLFRAGFDEERDTAAIFDVAETVADVAADERCSPAQLALAWVMTQPGVTAPIVGASTPEQIDDLAAVTEIRLSDDALKRVGAVSAVFR